MWSVLIGDPITADDSCVVNYGATAVQPPSLMHRVGRTSESADR